MYSKNSKRGQAPSSSESSPEKSSFRAPSKRPDNRTSFSKKQSIEASGYASSTGSYRPPTPGKGIDFSRQSPPSRPSTPGSVQSFNFQPLVPGLNTKPATPGRDLFPSPPGPQSPGPGSPQSLPSTFGGPQPHGSVKSKCTRTSAWEALLNHKLETRNVKKFNRINRGQDFQSGQTQLGVEDANDQKKQLIMSEIAFVIHNIFLKQMRRTFMEDSTEPKRFKAAVDPEEVMAEMFSQLRKRFQTKLHHLTVNNPQDFLADDMYFSDVEEERTKQKLAMKTKTYKPKM